MTAVKSTSVDRPMHYNTFQRFAVETLYLSPVEVFALWERADGDPDRAVETWIDTLGQGS